MYLDKIIYGVILNLIVTYLKICHTYYISDERILRTF